MQLKSLYIKNYKILKDFTIDFPYDFKKYISVFIGTNGSGKSTMLEAIAEIFSCMLLSKEAKFDFEIEYAIKSSSILSKFSINNPELKYIPIKITGDSGYLPKTEISFDLIPPEVLNYTDTRIKLSFAQRDFRNLMPDNIVIYYSGLSEIMEELCKPHEEKLSKAYRKGNIDIDRDFFYYKPEHFGIILLSLLSYEYGDIPVFLKSKGKINEMQSVKIRLKKPSWHKASIENFWGAEGEVRKFLAYLDENSAMSDDLNNPDSSGKKGNIVIEAQQDDALIITIIGLERLYEIREHLIEERKLFEILNILLEDGLLEDISFSLIKEDNGDYKSFNVLSEGEQQAIIIKGMIELLSGENTLFLFDEPDTYLHPEWQSQFLSEIESLIQKSTDFENTFLVATHSPLMLSNLRVGVIYRMVLGIPFEYSGNTYGKDSNLILSQTMETVPRVKNIDNELKVINDLIKESDFKTAKERIAKLINTLGETDPTLIRLSAIIKRKEIIGR